MRPIAVFVLLAASALAQNPAPPAFEIASVKINQQFRPEDRSTWHRTIDASPVTLTMRNVDLKMAVAWAHNLQAAMVSGPAWVESQRYDILAKTGAAAPDNEMRRMLQTLLAERFRLETHREMRPMEVMAIVLPKSGHKMTASQSDGPPNDRQDPQRGSIVEGAAVTDLGEELSRILSTPVVDLTGLKGRFDFTLNVQKYVSALRSRLMAEGRPMPESEAQLTIMQEALEGELGLRLEPRRAPVEVVVIDRAEKTPVEN